MNDDADHFRKAAYFPTLIFQIDVEQADTLNKSLLKAINLERQKNQKGIVRSNVKELGGWHSSNNLHKSPAYSRLVERVDAATRRISKELGYSVDHTMKIGTMWSIINPPGSLNIAHIHPGCLWSGVYYVQVPQNAGNIEFIEAGGNGGEVYWDNMAVKLSHAGIDVMLMDLEGDNASRISSLLATFSDGAAISPQIC